MQFSAVEIRFIVTTKLNSTLTNDLKKRFFSEKCSALASPDGLYLYKVMPFGMKNSPGTFQRLVNSLIFNLVGCKAYINDAIIFSEEWEQHLQTFRNFFDRLSEATLTVNLTNS